MARKKNHIMRLGLLVVLTGALLLLYSSSSNLSQAGNSRTDKHVYLALGFHINLYHSYRLDTNDELGFGKDIRIIRHIISTLDKLNRQGIPVRAVWDVDNLFSLQEFLPKYAPDIIRSLQRRIRENGDEIIFMSYNNALASTLNPDELTASIQRAFTNPALSGLEDLFESVSPIVRPQEMMITPGIFRQYQEMGLEAVVLYYSAIPFDAFRTFVRPLTPQEALNPLQYNNDQTGEKMTVIPAYTIGDLVENVSLGSWVRQLRQQQVNGEIDRDLLIFVNFDADDQYWAGLDLPWHLNWLPNTSGLEGVINEAVEAGFVRFTTLKPYLDAHPPSTRISFGQDTADGNFNGYNSWAEKATTPIFWTAVMEDRRERLLVDRTKEALGLNGPPEEIEARLDRSFDLRLRMLSTTNYGMAAPFVTGQREQTVAATMAKMKTVSAGAVRWAEQSVRRDLAARPVPPAPEPNLRFIDSLRIFPGSPGLKSASGGLLRLDLTGLKLKASDVFQLADAHGHTFSLELIKTENNASGFVTRSVFLIPDRPEVTAGVYFLFAGPGTSANRQKDSLAASKSRLKNEYLELNFSGQGLVSEVRAQGRQRLEAGSLAPFIRYGQDGASIGYRPTSLKVSKDDQTGFTAAAVRVRGDLSLPGARAIKNGSIDYRLLVTAGRPYLLVEGEISYPETERSALLSSGDPKLVKKYDSGWQEVAPLELAWTQKTDPAHPFKVLKRNYLGVESSYQIDYFRHSPQNLNLANINNHVTSEYLGVATPESGMAVAMDTTVLANFAFCPLKMTHESDDGLSLKLNPFGTYFGPQYLPPTWGNRYGYEAALLAGGQYRSSAPSYNGVTQQFMVMLAFFDGDKMPEDVKRALTAFAHPPLVVTGGRIRTWSPQALDSDRLDPPPGLLAASADNGVYLHWDRSWDRTVAYKIYCRGQGDSALRSYVTQDTSLLLSDLTKGGRYYAAISGLDGQGNESRLCPEIAFTAGAPFTPPALKVPLFFQIKFLWTGLLEKLEDNIL